MSVSSSESNPFGQAMRKQCFIPNFEFPSLNQKGMMWFRDDDVEIGESMCSILTILMPLSDPRDYDLTKLYLDADDPTVLHHVYPNVPSFMYRNYLNIHELEGSDSNPEIYSETRKKHKKNAFKIGDNKHLKLEVAEYQLPFALNTDTFDGIVNSGSEIMKHYRTFNIDIEVRKGEATDIQHTCAYIWWKVLIEGETTNCSTKTQEFRNVFQDAAERSRDPPGDSSRCYRRRTFPFVGDVIAPNKYYSNNTIAEAPASSGTELIVPDVSFSANPVLNDHLSRFANYNSQKFPPVPPTPNKKQKVDDFKPMDEDDVSL